jgi:hypothetical protein
MQRGSGRGGGWFSTRRWMVLIAIVALGLATRSAVFRAMRCLELAQDSDGVARSLGQHEGAEYSQAAQNFRRIAWRFWEPVPRAPGFLGMLDEWAEQNPPSKPSQKTRSHQTKPMAIWAIFETLRRSP